MFTIALFFVSQIIYSLFQVHPNAGIAQIKQLDVKYHIEFFYQDETLFTNENAFTIYYKDNWNVYKFHYHYDSVVDGKIMKEEMRKYYFVFKNGDQTGFKFYQDGAYKNGYAHVDSLLNTYALGNFSWEQITALTPVSTFDPATGVLEEIYPPSDREDNKDTLKFYYSNRFKDYEFSFSKKLDSLKNLKLFKVVAYNAPFYHKKLNKNFPERVSYFMMEEGKQDDLEEAEHYFREYRKMKQQKGK